MMTQDYMQHIVRLRAAVEAVLQAPLQTPRDFDGACETIAKQTRIRLSRTTLMRLWGYVREDVVPRESTLDVLAVFCGYTGWNDFILRTSSVAPSQSDPVMGKGIDTARDIPRGATITLTWQPGRTMTMRHDGDARFTVLDSERTRLVPGTTFKCHMIIENEPMWVSEVTIDGTAVPAYVCGRDTGIHVIEES